MEQPRISAIAAIGKNRELGQNNQLIWKFEADFARMKELIKGHPLVMGRLTYESIGRELPHSPSVVITSNEDYQSPYPNTKHTYVVNSLSEALHKAAELENGANTDEKEVFIFGGGKVYSDALPETERLYLTEIDAEAPDADSFFPEYNDFTTTLETTEHKEGDIRYRLLTLER